MIRVLGVFVPVRFTEDDRSEPMSSQPNGAWLTQDAYDRLAKELAELEGPGRTEIAEAMNARSTLRGQVVTFGGGTFGEAAQAVQFHPRPQIAAGRLQLDGQLGVITLDGMALRLTAFEQRIMTYLITHQDRVISRTELSEHLYEAETDRDFKSIEVVIGRLRKKVGDGIIETRRGEGYVLRSA